MNKRRKDTGFVNYDDNSLQQVVDFNTGDLGAYDTAETKQIQALEQQLNNALIPTDAGTFRFRRFEMTTTQLIAPSDLTNEECNEFGRMISALESASQFWMGDWANLYIKQQKNKDERSKIYERLAEDFNIEAVTLKDYAYVCWNVPQSLRNDRLSYSHHKAVVAFSENPKKQESYLNYAIENQLGVGAFRKWIKDQENPNDEEKTASQQVYERMIQERARIEHAIISSKTREERELWLAFIQAEIKSWQEFANDIILKSNNMNDKT